MDYGPSLINTYEIGRDGTNFAYKGIAVRLDPGPGGISRGSAWMIFDHDTLRVAAGWSGEASSTGTGSTSTASTRSIRGSSGSCSSRIPTGAGLGRTADGTV